MLTCALYAVPVRVTTLSIDVSEFTPNLYPLVAKATLELKVLTPDAYAHAAALGARLADGIDTIAAAHGLDWRAPFRGEMKLTSGTPALAAVEATSPPPARAARWCAWSRPTAPTAATTSTDMATLPSSSLRPMFARAC